VLVDDESMQATVIVPEDNLALAIGREGQNARLAARLTGWRIDIRSAAEYDANAPDEPGAAGAAGGELQDDGRCHAILKTGKRCPNAAEPGEQFCSLHEGWVAPEVEPEAEPEEPAVAEVEADAEAEPVAEASEPEAEAAGEETAGVAASEGDAEADG
jgi:N utilization substance protein A